MITSHGSFEEPRPPLQAALHGDAFAMATQPDVVHAPTFAEMVRRSRIPERFWYAPIIEPRIVPVVTAETARGVSDRVTALKTRRGWTNAELADALAVGPGVLWRFTHGKIHHDEVDGVLTSLTRLESGS